MTMQYYKPFQTEPIDELRRDEGELPSDSNQITDDYSPHREDEHEDIIRDKEESLNTVSLLDYQTEELKKLRGSSSRMTQEIDHLKSQVRHLESENGSLKRELAVYTNPTAWLADSAQLEDLSKSELIARYVAIKDKYLRQSDELQDYKDRVHKLQSDLLTKNDLDKDYLTGTARSYKQLQKRLEEEMMKVRRLQTICRSQEELIAEWQKRRDYGHYYWRWYGKDRLGLNDTIYEENRRLRSELGRLGDWQSKYSKEDLDRYQYYDWWGQLVDDRRRWHNDRLPLLRDKTYYYYDYDPIRDKKYPDPLKRLVPVGTTSTGSPRTNSDGWLPELTPRRSVYD